MLEIGPEVAYKSTGLKNEARHAPLGTRALLGLGAFVLSTFASWAGSNVFLTEVPDYAWFAGCFGTASGNIMGYWDRHGFPNFYTGPTAGGVAPLNNNGANQGIRSMWASQAGVDGRPPGQFGHIDDYWLYYSDIGNSYESTAPDPYLTAGRAEHTPDCIGDFIGLSQKKWTNMNGECDGNLDGFSFVFWDTNGNKRANYVPPAQNGRPVPDIPSGLRVWAASRGYVSDVFSQLVDFNPTVPSGAGFTFTDLKDEIDAGYPVLLFLQEYDELSRSFPGMPRANPHMHGMLAYGYYISDTGDAYVRYRTSWASGNNNFSYWDAREWQANLPVRGVIGFHPLPQITKVTAANQTLTFQWDGPSSVLTNTVDQTSMPLHWYVVERATRLAPPDYQALSAPVSQLSVTITNCCPDVTAFFRVKLVPPPGAAQTQP